MSQLKIREMPEEERPREKLLARGPDALTNAELIAILLRTGRPGMNVVEVARELLDRYKSFAELSRCSIKELSERSEEHTSELQSQSNLVCRLLLETKQH